MPINADGKPAITISIAFLNTCPYKILFSDNPLALAFGTKGISQIINHEFDLADFAREYVFNNDNYKLYSFENSLSICFNSKKYDPIDLCTKLYEKNKVLVGFGYFNKQCFIRLVTINGENSKKDILNFFKTLEEFVESNKDLIKKIK